MSFATRPNSPLGSGALLRLARIRAEILFELALHVPVLVGIRRLRPLAAYVRPLRRIVPVQLEPRLGDRKSTRLHSSPSCAYRMPHPPCQTHVQHAHTRDTVHWK